MVFYIREYQVERLLGQLLWIINTTVFTNRVAVSHAGNIIGDATRLSDCTLFLF